MLTRDVSSSRHLQIKRRKQHHVLCRVLASVWRGAAIKSRLAQPTPDVTVFIATLTKRAALVTVVCLALVQMDLDHLWRASLKDEPFVAKAGGESDRHRIPRPLDHQDTLGAY